MGYAQGHLLGQESATPRKMHHIVQSRIQTQSAMRTNREVSLFGDRKASRKTSAEGFRCQGSKQGLLCKLEDELGYT